MWRIFNRFHAKPQQPGKLEIRSKQNRIYELIAEDNNAEIINTERNHRKGETQLYFNCPNCGVNISVPEEYRGDENLVCCYCKESFKNPLLKKSKKEELKLDNELITEDNNDEIINTEKNHRKGETQLYFNCPNCGVNVSVPEEYRGDENLVCYYCKKSFKNPLLKKSKKEELKLINEMDDENRVRYEIIKPIIKKYFDKCDIPVQESMSILYSDDDIFNLVDDDNLTGVMDYLGNLHSFIKGEIDNGNHTDLDDVLSSLNNMKNVERQLAFLKDLDKIYKLIRKKNTNVTFPELIKLFYELFQSVVDQENEIIIKHEYLRIEKKLSSNISIKSVLKEFIKTPLKLQINKNQAKLLLEKFNLEFNIEQLDDLIEKIYEEIELEEFEQSLEEEDSPKILLDPTELNGLEFEGFLKQLFERLGYTVIKTKASGDQGADLILTLDNVKTAVQAKRYSGKVSNKAIQEVVASKKYYKCDKVMVVTTGKFTKSAIQLAISNEVELWDSDKLLKIINDINDSNNNKIEL